ncbi:MAG: GNAT family N-acetyltransferase [Dehalococcoidia bacterium]
MRLRFEALTPDNWEDFVRLFGENGACGGCWCTLWRMTRSEHEKGKGERNKSAMKRIVESGAPVGILAYLKEESVGWCAVAPRKDYPALARSRVLKPIDDRPVWSVACLFVDRAHRNRGISVALLRAAASYAAERGGSIVEGYPVEPRKPKMPDVFAWTGTAAAFTKAGYKECARGSESRPIMRRKASKNKRSNLPSNNRVESDA